ncbi:MAG: DNA alkylation repair protein [Bacilli bacterium]|nr:DNA alkylation repair protein [Bacilli bacterium]
MTFEEFDKLLYPNGKPEKEYLNMVGIDHLIPSCSLYTKEWKDACKKVINDPSFDVEQIPFDEIVEYQLCYFAINLMRIKSYQNQLEFIYSHSYIAKSWMTTDMCNQYLKYPRFAEFKPYFLKFIKQKGHYQKRFGYVLGLRFAKDEEAAKLFLKNMIKDDAYYVMMGQAWLIAEIGIYHFDLVKEFLMKSDNSITLKKKAISKMIDSFRINQRDKEVLKEIRQKL